jgi:hypothetical protein
MRYLFGIAAITFLAAGMYVVPGPSQREPFDEGRWSLESVMLINEATTSTYVLDPPFRVIRSGQATVSRRDESVRRPVVRVDLTVDGEPVTVYSRLREEK